MHDGNMMPVVVVRCAAVNGCLGDPRTRRSRRHHVESRIRLEVAEAPRELRLLIALQKYDLVLIIFNELLYEEVLAFGATTGPSLQAGPGRVGFLPHLPTPRGFAGGAHPLVRCQLTMPRPSARKANNTRAVTDKKEVKDRKKSGEMVTNMFLFSCWSVSEAQK